MAFFSGDLEGRNGHEKMAKKIAEQGQEYAAKYWRYADMEACAFLRLRGSRWERGLTCLLVVDFFRLALEWARATCAFVCFCEESFWRVGADASLPLQLGIASRWSTKDLGPEHEVGSSGRTPDGPRTQFALPYRYIHPPSSLQGYAKAPLLLRRACVSCSSVWRGKRRLTSSVPKTRGTAVLSEAGSVQWELTRWQLRGRTSPSRTH